MRLVLAGFAILLGMILLIAGIGIINSALLLRESGMPRRYQTTQSVNVHDSYYTIDPLSILPIGGVPDVRIGGLMICVSLLVYCGVVVSFVRSRRPKSKLRRTD